MSQIAFLFPGQGAQHVGMGKSLSGAHPAAKELYERANEVLGFDLKTLCFEGPQEQLNSTDISQPALFVSSLAALEILKAESPETIEACSATAGLSLGEYTALVFAGAMNFEDGLRVVRTRGEAMQSAAEANPSGMVSILLLEPEKVEDICRQASDAGPVQIANYLCPGNLVISGTKSACDSAAKLAEEAGGRSIPLSVAGAFHTSFMEPAIEPLREVLASVELKSPRIAVISNVDSESHSDPDEIRELLVRQVVSPVRWEDSVRKLLERGFDEFYEIGPGKVLTGLMKRIARKIPCRPINDS
jgi:[acyl-carrier-protein] S-malonyltransferase